MDQHLKELIKNSPQTPGVYLFSNQTGKVIYVGKAINLRSRLQSYRDPKLEGKTVLMVSEAKNLRWVQVFSELEALILEAALIQKYLPIYNIRLVDDRSFLYIAVTNEEFPKIYPIRKGEITDPKYIFGPFPSASTVRQMLKFLRRIFPFCQQKNDRKPCFWSHLGLCNPCPGEIKSSQDKKRYLKNIKNLVYILSGKSGKLLKQLEKEMKATARQQDFEQANYLKNKITQLNYLTSSNFPVSTFLENANFFQEQQQKELEELFRVIPAQAGIQSFSRIECYDISNLSGQFSVGSMVVFINGVASKNDYRKFKIKITGKPNDVEMMKEMLTRRLNHPEWPYPDLIVVDGGKPQVSACYSALVHCNKNIPVIGLAKRLETIVVPTTLYNLHPTTSFKEINLPVSSPALNLLKRLRDETHRFAITYHRKLRKKAFML